MKICFIVRSIAHQVPSYTTVHLAYEAYRRGHEVFFASIFDLSYNGTDEKVCALAKSPARWDIEERAEFLKHVHSVHVSEGVNLSEFDAVFLRHNANDVSWEQDQTRSPAIEFGRILKRQGVKVYNDPDGLTRAASKMYLSTLPKEITPATLTSKNPEEIRDFIGTLGKPVVLKPLYGSGGHDVFFVESESDVNLNQIVGTIAKTSYVLVQEYLPAASRGDKRLLLLNGTPIMVDGKVALYGRRPSGDDLRSNMKVGGKRYRAQFTGAENAIVEAIRPQLFEDGLFFVGADIVGDKLLELNVFCPGGIQNINDLLGVNVGDKIIEELEGLPNIWQVPASALPKTTQ